MRQYPRHLIIDALDFADIEHEQLVTDYSGKAMYGSECFGIKLRQGYGQLAQFLVALGSAVATSGCDDDECDACDLDDLAEVTHRLVGSVEIDSLGHDLIAYFRGWRLWS